jgi:ABC-2 type transport system permease protein
MTAALSHGALMSARWLRALWRQPWYVAITLVQPVIWLLLFGALFERVVDIPGFGADDYVDFLVPGIVVMTALFTAGWNGMGIINDLDRGVLARFLVSPARRSSLIAGPLGQLGVVVVIQSVIIVALGLTVGASLAGGVGGVAVMIGCSILLAWAIGGLSIAIALVARKEETLIGAVNFLVLPLTFLSTAFMPSSLAPGWVEDVSRYNPVDWAIEAGREAIGADPDWSVIGTRAGLLAAAALLCGWLATRALRAYQRSV